MSASRMESSAALPREAANRRARRAEDSGEQPSLEVIRLDPASLEESEARLFRDAEGEEWAEDSEAEPELASFEERLQEGKDVALAIHRGLTEVIYGQEEPLAHVVTSLLAGGHVLLEGAPGLGKTQIVRTLGALTGASLSRIQFTPDLMPSDILGTTLVQTTSSGQRDFLYREGPIFASMVLADEINRATPKTQSALLEAMAEGTVSVDGASRPLPRPFFVLATENPIEMEGVFPLPEAQLDRFLMKLVLGMPDLATLARIGERGVEASKPAAVTTPRALLAIQETAREVACPAHVSRYAARLVVATHARAGVRYGAGPRAVQALIAAGRVRAMVAGRPAVSTHDVALVASPVLGHRIVLGFEAQARGETATLVIAAVVRELAVDG